MQVRENIIDSIAKTYDHYKNTDGLFHYGEEDCEIACVVAVYLREAVREDNEDYFRYLMTEKCDYIFPEFLNDIFPAIKETKRYHYLELYIVLYDIETDYEEMINFCDCNISEYAVILINCLCKLKVWKVEELYDFFIKRGYVDTSDVPTLIAFEELGINIMPHLNSHAELKKCYYKEDV